MVCLITSYGVILSRLSFSGFFTFEIFQFEVSDYLFIYMGIFTSNFENMVIPTFRVLLNFHKNYRSKSFLVFVSLFVLFILVRLFTQKTEAHGS